MLITNKNNLDPLYVETCKSDYEYKDKRYSVTQIVGKSPRETLLKRRHNDETIIDCKDLIWAKLGTGVHKIFEDVNTKLNVEREMKLEYHTKNGYTLSGICDAYYPDLQRVLDWKTATVWKVVHKDFDDYIEQLKMYAVILRANGRPCNKGRLFFILKDWSHSQVLQDKYGTYPKDPQVQLDFDFTEEEINETQEWIENYFLEIEKLEKLSDADLPLCDKDIRTFNGQDKFAVKKPNRKSALRVLDSEQEAKDYIANYDEKLRDTLYIEYRPCEEKKCMEYCQASPFCYNFIYKYANYLVVTNKEKVRAGFLNRFEAQEFINTFNLQNSCYIKEIIRIKEGKEND